MDAHDSTQGGFSRIEISKQEMQDPRIHGCIGLDSRWILLNQVFKARNARSEDSGMHMTRLRVNSPKSRF